ncbi:MAG: YkgJ family cysteine cluster protein, partial [Candidatus Helarchaeota archaeon]
PDILNKKILVITYRIILEGKDKVCPFFSKENMCLVNDIKPLTCRAYPLAQKRIDAFNVQIDIDPLCKFIQKHKNTIKNFTSQDIKDCFPDEFIFSEQLMNKNQNIILKIRLLTKQNKIEIPSKVDSKDFSNWLNKWEREFLEDF